MVLNFGMWYHLLVHAGKLDKSKVFSLFGHDDNRSFGEHINCLLNIELLIIIRWISIFIL